MWEWEEKQDIRSKEKSEDVWSWSICSTWIFLLDLYSIQYADTLYKSPKHPHRTKKRRRRRENKRGRVKECLLQCECPLTSLKCPAISKESVCWYLDTCTEATEGHLDTTHTHYACIQKHKHSIHRTTYTHPTHGQISPEASVAWTDNHSLVSYKIKPRSTDTTKTASWHKTAPLKAPAVETWWWWMICPRERKSGVFAKW